MAPFGRVMRPKPGSITKANGGGHARLDYGLSTFGKAIPWSAADAFTLYFLTDVAGIPALESGLIVFLFLGWNALCDPLAGWAMDRFCAGRPPPPLFFKLAALGAAVFFVLSFAAPPSGPLRTPLLVVAGLAFRTFYSAMDVPHNAMLARLAERGRAVGLGAMRLLASIAATLVIGLAAKGAVSAAGPAAAHTFATWALALAVVSTAVFLTWLPRPQAGEATGAPGAAAPEPHAAPPIAALALVFLSAMIATVVSSVFSKDLVYLAKYVFGDATRVVQFLTAMTLGKLLAIPLWWWAPRRLGVVGSMAAAYGLTAAAGSLLAGSGPNPRLFEAGLVAMGMGVGGGNMLTWALMPALARPRGAEAARGVTVRVFGFYTALTKVAAGASGLLLGLFLALTRVGDAAPHPGASERLYLMACLVPVLGSLACILCLGGYRILCRLERSGSNPPRRRRPVRS